MLHEGTMPRKRKAPLPRDGKGGEKRQSPPNIGADPESALDAAPPDDGVRRDKLGRRIPERHPRIDDVEAHRRREVIRKAIIQGFPSADIILYVKKETDWDLSTRQVERYIGQALKSIREAAKRDRETEVGKAIERNDMLFRQAISPPLLNGKKQAPDLRVAARANQQNARLMGLEAPLRHRHGADPDAPPLPPGGDFILLVQEVVE
jgi:hypothetical protein